MPTEIQILPPARLRKRIQANGYSFERFSVLVWWNITNVTDTGAKLIDKMIHEVLGNNYELIWVNDKVFAIAVSSFSLDCSGEDRRSVIAMFNTLDGLCLQYRA